MKKTFRYGTQIAFRETIKGSLWCAAGIFTFFGNWPCKVMGVILLALALLSQIFTILGKFEKEDEMAIANLSEAKSITLDYLRSIIMIAYIVFLLLPNDFVASLDWSKIIASVLVFLIGLPEVMVGLLFKRIEEE